MHNQSSTEMRAESKIPKMTQKQTAIDQRAILSICGNSNFSLDTALRVQYAAPQIVVTAAKMTLITNGANASFQQRSSPGADVSEKSTHRKQKTRAKQGGGRVTEFRSGGGEEQGLQSLRVQGSFLVKVHDAKAVRLGGDDKTEE